MHSRSPPCVCLAKVDTCHLGWVARSGPSSKALTMSLVLSPCLGNWELDLVKRLCCWRFFYKRLTHWMISYRDYTVTLRDSPEETSQNNLDLNALRFLSWCFWNSNYLARKKLSKAIFWQWHWFFNLSLVLSEDDYCWLQLGHMWCCNMKRSMNECSLKFKQESNTYFGFVLPGAI